jgi:hypothetical protein
MMDFRQNISNTYSIMNQQTKVQAPQPLSHGMPQKKSQMTDMVTQSLYQGSRINSNKMSQKK